MFGETPSTKGTRGSEKDPVWQTSQVITWCMCEFLAKVQFFYGSISCFGDAGLNYKLAQLGFRQFFSAQHSSGAWPASQRLCLPFISSGWGLLRFPFCGGGQGGGNPGVVAAGSVREAREERAEDATGYPRGWESGEIGTEFRNNAQYFAIEKAHRGGNHKVRGWEPGVQGTGSGKLRPPCPPHQSGVLIEFIKILGDWHSDAMLLYLMVPLNVRLQSVNVMANSISTNNTNHTTHSLGLECN